MNRLYMLLMAMLTTSAALAQTDTATVKGEQLQEVIVNANNAQRRLSMGQCLVGQLAI